MKESVIMLPPLNERVSELDALEKEITRAFRKALYGPLLKILGVGERRLSNAKVGDPVLRAIADGKVSIQVGRLYKGRELAVQFEVRSDDGFGAEVSKALKELGAKWHAKSGTFRIHQSELPAGYLGKLEAASKTASDAWAAKAGRIDDQLRQILPAEIAGTVKSAPLFSSSLWKADRKIDNTVKSISVLPKLTPERRAKIADEWRNNLERWITDFAAEEIPKLRDEVQKHAMRGGRFEDLVNTLQKSYGVTRRKARFLARQETNLLLSKFKESRYAEAGITEYQWNCVAGSKEHPVRPSHLALKGKVFRFDDPPITTGPDEPPRRNNPGEDFNCRCFARPIVRAAHKRKRA